MKTHFFILLSATLLLGGSATVRGQSALDGFDPKANGTVRVVVVQPDGKILIGGDFTTLAPNGGMTITRGHIARLNPDGTLDTAFNPGANGIVNAIAVQADGNILAGGEFTTIGGQTRHHIARLDATTGLADSFDPNANDVVLSIAVQADGKILAGGGFHGTNSIGGQLRNRLARLDPVTGMADAFDPNANDYVFSILVQGDGKILAGGSFAAIGGQLRNCLARLDPSSGSADSFAPNASSIVFSIAIQADGKIVAAGDFSLIGGQSRNYIARLDPLTGLADSFDPHANADIRSIVVQADGKILLGGFFTSLVPNGGATVTRLGLARMNPEGTADAAFDPNPNSSGIYALAQLQDGKILVGGDFTALAPNVGVSTARNCIARLETDGLLDRTIDLGIIGNDHVGNFFVHAVALQPDGKILIGGSFSNVLGMVRNEIARLNTDGTLDMAFNPNADDQVDTIAVQADGKILVGGNFTHIGGQTRTFMARLDGTSGAADSFAPNAEYIVNSIAVQADGKILVGGDFHAIGGQSRTNLARLDPITGAADAFNPNPNGLIYTLAVQADGKILAGGTFVGASMFASIGGASRDFIARLDATNGTADSFNPTAGEEVYAIAVQADAKVLAGGFFTDMGGQSRNHLARLNSTTGAVDSFDPNANRSVYSIAVQADGKILAGGSFTNIGGQFRNYVARLDDASGSAYPSFNPNADDDVRAIAVQADGKILTGGTFLDIGGQPRNLFARLSSDTPALQNLAVTQTAITWTHAETFFVLSNSTTQVRGGASPLFTRVTFELSTNNLNYTFLGNGVLAAGDWTLTGLNLPTGQNLYIRARGFYRTGYGNNSESISESIRNAFLTPLAGNPPRLNIQRTGSTNVVLSWATNFTGFTLESRTNFNTTNWNVVSPAPAVSGTNNVVTNTVIGPTRFYRLRK